MGITVLKVLFTLSTLPIKGQIVNSLHICTYTLMGTHFYQAFVQKVVVASLWRSAVCRDLALFGEQYLCGSFVERKTRCDRPQQIEQVHQV